MVLAQIQGARHAESAAIAAAQEAIDIRRSLAKNSGGNKGSHLHLAVGLKDSAGVYATIGRRELECPALRESLAIMQTYQDDGTLSKYDSENNLKPVIQARSEEHTSELQSLMRISYAVFCLTKKTKIPQ